MSHSLPSFVMRQSTFLDAFNPRSFFFEHRTSIEAFLFFDRILLTNENGKADLARFLRAPVGKRAVCVSYSRGNRIWAVDALLSFPIKPCTNHKYFNGIRLNNYLDPIELCYSNEENILVSTTYIFMRPIFV